MELGKGKLLRTGLNALHQAVHPIHGLAWTDGSQVVLTDLQLHSGEVKLGDSKVIGQFERVYGLSWAPLGTAGTPTLLAVQHKKHVTVWQLCPNTAEMSKRLMSQTCDIRELLPVLPQGCVWHPKSAVLTVLTAQAASVFHNVHSDSVRVKADIDTQGHIHCACWTRDGQRLVVAVDNSLHSYIWDSALKTLHRCSFCPVFDVDSNVRAIGATVDSQIAIATELPLDKICGLNASETFDVLPSDKDSYLCSLPVSSAVPSLVKGANASEIDSEIPVSPFDSSSSDPLDLTHLRVNRSGSEVSSLICLRKKDNLTGTGQDSSHLVLVTFGKEVTMTRKVTIPGILVPDLIAFNLEAQVVAVASSTCNIILIYSVIPSSMPNIQHIQLENDERPKGIYFLTDKLLLILVGTQKPADWAFLSSSKSDQYIIHLVIKEVMLEEASSVASNESQSSHATFSALLTKAHRRKQIESLQPDFCHQNRELLLPSSISYQSASTGRTLIKEIKSHPSSICECTLALETLNAEPVNRSVTKARPSSPAESSPVQFDNSPVPPNLPQRKNLQTQKEACKIGKKLEVLSSHLTEMQRCLSELTNCLHSEKSPPGYPLSRDPPYVHIIYQKPYSGVEKRAVLLCDGKLRLSAVQQTFDVSLIEMLHDSLWILLSADSEGFIPLTFTTTQEVIIRDGNLSRSDVFKDSFSQSLDPGLSLEIFSRDRTAQSLDTTGCSNNLGTRIKSSQEDKNQSTCQGPSKAQNLVSIYLEQKRKKENQESKDYVEYVANSLHGQLPPLS
ncbi:PREDICTED: WD repeat-containing protein C2orf44 homolog [Chrysochloris asiatica]|uniref:WD repeat and coiled-coil-containing protein n=1 Tax=Chrysochloris asiatica TaxID=185453 RepID=A0A9B0T4R1_CHRAS|nr:PREDICTED: WD repeat-containing protein C2orf44 homolog [Chrysochloris asiatica]